MRLTTLAAGLAVCLLLFPCAGAQAETTLDVSGQVRVRAELDGRDFNPNAATLQFTDLRARVGVSARVEENTQVFVQIQDARRLGGFTSGGNTSGTLINGSNVDVHQAFLKLSELWDGGPGVQAGRFEVNLGNQRLFGSVGWSNVGRSWEGANAFLAREGFHTQVFWLKALERNNTAENQDFDIWGVYTELNKAGLDLFGFLEHDAEELSTINNLDRITLGGYFQRDFESVDVELSGVLQLGDQLVGTMEQNISAYLITGELGYTVESGKARLAAGIDLASGDSDLADDEVKAFNNLYYTGHKFRGYMDYFLGSGPFGLMDLMARGKFSPTRGWTLKGDLHYFRTAQDYVDFLGEETSSVGVEIDVAASTSRIAGIKTDLGVSLFLPSDSFAGSNDADTGLWAYTMLTANFGGTVK